MARWDGVDEFVQVVESGGFAAAAGALGVSKAHVSKQVRLLEDRLGTRLLQRTTRRQALTEAGERFYRRCVALIDEFDDLQTTLQEAREVPHGKLRISVAGAFAERYVAPVCAEFSARYPQVQLELVFDNRIVDLVQEGFDLAIRYGELKASTLVARRIAPRHLRVCASPEYLRRHGVPERPEALREHECLLGTSEHWLFRGDGGTQRLRVNGRWRSNNGMALVMAARQGLGLTQLPDFYVEEDLRSGRLQAVLSEWELGDVGVWAIYPHRRHLTAKVRLLVDWLAQAFQPQPPWHTG
jgi:DNA-binding transcriptional LysR family regulator